MKRDAALMKRDAALMKRDAALMKQFPEEFSEDFFFQVSYAVQHQSLSTNQRP